MADRAGRRGGVRLRTSAAATLVVALVLAAASVAFVVLQRHQLESSLTSVARQQASDVAERAARDGADPNLLGGGGDQSLVQVVDQDGVVVAASASIDGEGPIIALRPAPGEVIVTSSRNLPIGEGDTFVVVARGVSGPDGPLVVLAAQSLETVRDSTDVVIKLLVVGYPLILLAVALTSYWLTGRALAPVESIRRRVASIEGTSDLAARVPLPPGSDEISRLGQTMNDMLARLEASAEAQRRFVGDASHELRSPLATIRAVHEIHALHPDAADTRQVFGEVLTELDRVDRLVADLLLLARADEHGLTLEKRDVDLDDLLVAEANRLWLAGIPDVAMTCPAVRVIGDPHHLARMLRNLVDNAARHAHRRVALSLRVTPDGAMITVADDGPGIAPDDRARVFERFVRLDESRARDDGGTGLGLPIARQIARAHGGDIVLEDGPGATFTITIPLHPGADQATRP